MWRRPPPACLSRTTTRKAGPPVSQIPGPEASQGRSAVVLTPPARHGHLAVLGTCAEIGRAPLRAELEHIARGLGADPVTVLADSPRGRDPGTGRSFSNCALSPDPAHFAGSPSAPRIPGLGSRPPPAALTGEDPAANGRHCQLGRPAWAPPRTSLGLRRSLQRLIQCLTW